MPDREIKEWGVYECGACGALEIGGLLGETDSGSTACPNCDNECSDLTEVAGYKLTKK